MDDTIEIPRNGIIFNASFRSYIRMITHFYYDDMDRCVQKLVDCHPDGVDALYFEMHRNTKISPSVLPYIQILLDPILYLQGMSMLNTRCYPHHNYPSFIDLLGVICGPYSGKIQFEAIKIMMYRGHYTDVEKIIDQYDISELMKTHFCEIEIIRFYFKYANTRALHSKSRDFLDLARSNPDFRRAFVVMMTEFYCASTVKFLMLNRTYLEIDDGGDLPPEAYPPDEINDPCNNYDVVFSRIVRELAY